MSKTKKFNDASIPKVDSVADSIHIAVFDASGKLSAVSVGDFRASSLNVGGRNLLKGTADFKGWISKTGGSVKPTKVGCFSVATCIGAFSGMMTRTRIYLTEGRTYTLSCFTNDPDNTSLYPSYSILSYISEAEGTKHGFRKELVGDNLYRVSVLFDCTKSGFAYTNIESARGGAEFYGPKLELGKVATDWSPAPEDIIEAIENSVSKEGDTMTGPLTTTELFIKGLNNSDAHLTASTGHDLAVVVNGSTLMCWVEPEKAVRAALGLSGQISLGADRARWSNIFAKTINVTSKDLVSNLNADLLDGKHAADFVSKETFDAIAARVSALESKKGG